jgi:ferredoxin
MTYVVNDKCIMCKHTTCVAVCPVDCFYEGPNMLVINPDECIDCGVCEPECPEEAITPDHLDKDGKWKALNQEYSNIWPNITEEKEPMADHQKYSGEEGKFDKYFKNG